MEKMPVSSAFHAPTITEFTVLGRKHPLSQDVLEARGTYGPTVRELVGDSDRYAVCLDDEPLPVWLWDWVRPLPQQTLSISALPAGENARDTLLGFALLAAAVFAGPAGTWLAGTIGGSATLWTGAIFAATALATNSLVRIPSLPADPAGEPLAAVGSFRNRLAQYDPVPVLYGKWRIYPPYAAQPFTEIVGGELFWHGLFAIGIGDHVLSEIKTGETLLNEWPGVEVLQTKTPDWPNVSELSVATELDEPLEPQPLQTEATFTTDVNVEAISCDFACPAGLIYIRDQGDRESAKIDFRVEFRAAGSSDPWINVRDHVFNGRGWVHSTLGADTNVTINRVGPLLQSSANPTAFRVAEATRDGFRFGLKWEVAEGQYDVRVTRLALYHGQTRFNGNGPEQREFAKFAAIMIWSTLRSHDTDPAPVTTTTVDYLKIRVRAANQLKGSLEDLNCIAERKLQTWNGATWNTPTVTRNPAWAYLDVLMGDANDRPISQGDAPNEITLADFLAWAQYCNQQGFAFDHYLEQRTSVFELIQIIAASGRATRSMRDGKHTILKEEDSAQPRQILTDRNSWGFRMQQKFFDMPHAFRIPFASEEADYQQDEIVVYDDGFDEMSATRFETLPPFIGVAKPDNVWRFGRFHIAQARLRPALYYRQMNFEHLASVRGDVVHMQSDVMLAALGSGRITRRWGDNIRTDEGFDCESGKTYTMKAVVVLDPQPETQVLDFIVTPTRFGEGVRDFTTSNLSPFVQEGVHIIFGESATVTVPAKIINVEPLDNLQAQLTLVDAAPEILAADTGAIPTYTPNITVRPDNPLIAPPVPTIIKVTSESSAFMVHGGGRLARMIVAISFPSGSGTRAKLFMEVRYRPQAEEGEAPWRVTPSVDATRASVAITDVESGETYEVQARLVSVYGLESDWTATTAHTVATFGIPPAKPASLTAVGVENGVKLTVGLTGVDGNDVGYIQFTHAPSNDRADPLVTSVTFPAPSNINALTAIDMVVPFSDVLVRYFWVRLIDQLGNTSSYEPLSATGGVRAASRTRAPVVFDPEFSDALRNWVGIESGAHNWWPDLGVAGKGAVQLDVANSYLTEPFRLGQVDQTLTQGNIQRDFGYTMEDNQWFEIDVLALRQSGNTGTLRLSVFATDINGDGDTQGSSVDVDLNALGADVWHRIRRNVRASLPTGVAPFYVRVGVTQTVATDSIFISYLNMAPVMNPTQFSTVQTFANNAAAISGGLVVGDIYTTSTGELRIVV